MNATNKTTVDRSPYGARSFGIHEEFSTLDQYFASPDIDRHFTHLFGAAWQDHTGEKHEIHWVSSSGEFIVLTRDKNIRPRGFVLVAYCPTMQIANLEISGWIQGMDQRSSLNQIIEFLERTFPV